MIEKKLPPLLITASLDAGKTPHVALRNIHDRTVSHLEGLLAWMHNPLVAKIVFAKNCSAQIRSEILYQTAATYGKEFEFIQTSASSRTLRQGKGYGEGHLIKEALPQSLLLRSEAEFIKVTGKLFTPHVSRLTESGDNGTFFLNPHTVGSGGTQFFRNRLSPLYRSETGSEILGFLKNTLRVPWGLIAAPDTGWIDTRFYRVRRDFYEAKIINAYRRVQDSLGYTLEAAFYDDLRHESGVHFLKRSPDILGVSGTLGTTAAPYPEDIRELAADLSVKLLA